MASSTIVASSNAAQQKELKLLKQIKVEQNFANQAYANFQTIRFGIESCCYTDFANAVVEKDLCDWQNAASTKVVAAINVSMYNALFIVFYLTTNVVEIIKNLKSLKSIPHKKTSAIF